MGGKLTIAACILESDICAWVRDLWLSRLLYRFSRARDSPKTPLALGIRFQRFIQYLFIKVRPQRRREKQFTVGGFPYKKVREPVLPAGADDQVRFRDIARPQ